MWYQRIVEVDALHEAPLGTPKIQQGKRRRTATPLASRKRFKQRSVAGADNSEEEAAEDSEDEDQIHDFRRVYVVYKNPVLTSQLHRRRNYSSSIADSVPSGSGILAGDPSLSNEDMQPNVPQIYTVRYPVRSEI
jgi:hypothetical protein